MPAQEAPAELLASSPEEHSFVQEFPLIAAPPGPVAMAQVQMPRLPAEVVVQADVQQRNQRNLQRNHSFDRELLTLEAEERQLPAFVHLLPVVLPQQAPEPTLDELLRRVTERNDLQNVESVHLRVISYSISLSRLSLFLPRLQQLDLSGSVLSSLRDLGYGLLHLTQLNVSNCGLNSFDGTSGLPAIRVLTADGNMIQRVGPLAELPLLARLSVRNNRISELGLLSFLGMCPNLAEVELRGNPVCNLPLYRATLQRSVPTLQLLDGQSLQTLLNTAPENPTASASPHRSNSTGAEDDELSSLSSDLYSEASSPSIEYGQLNNRLASAEPNDNNGTTILSLRPITNDDSHNGSVTGSIGTPVAGSLLGLVRRTRRRSGRAWASSSSSSSGGSSIASSRPPSVASNSSNSVSLDLQSTPLTFQYTPR